MTTFTDTLALLIKVDPGGAANVVKGFTSTAQSDLAKVEGLAGTSGSRAGGLFGQNFQKQALVGFAALQATVGGFAIASFGKAALEDAVQLNRNVAQLDATLASAGGQAGVTQASLDRLADSVQKSDAIYKGTVKGAEALLLTLGSIRNEAGKGNDVFNRTITVASAMSNVFGKDLNQSTIQLGRALENPATGMQALSRSGVALSQTLRDQVITLSRHGDLLGAQKVLLDELEKRYVSAGAAIAKADPFQQFSVAMTEFKTQIGEDLLPAVTESVTIVGDLLSGFKELPGPIRTVTELLIFAGVVVAPLLKINAALNAIKATGAAATATKGAEAVSTAPAVAGEEALTVAEKAQGAAAVDAAASTALLSDQLVVVESFATKAALAEQELAVAQGEAGTTAAAGAAEADALAVALDTEAASAVVATEETTAFSLSLGGIAGIALLALAGIGAIAQAQSIMSKVVGAGHTDFDKLSSDFKRIADDANRVRFDSFTDKIAHLHSVAQAKNDLADLNKGFTDLMDSEGIKAATLQFGEFIQQFQANGGDISKEAIYFQPFLDALDAANAAEATNATQTYDLASAYDQLAGSLADVDTKLKIADAFDSVSDAQKKVAADKQDIAGTSQKAKDADRAEADALTKVADAGQKVIDSHRALADSYTKLQDAQDSVTSSTRNLLEAQAALDLFNSPRGAQERALQLDSLQRRVVSTPAEEDQKQLDLLKFKDDNDAKKLNLEDSVASASKSLRDAQRGVLDAQQGIAQAQLGINKAVQDQATAEQGVADAVSKRKKVTSDAMEALKSDQRKVEELWIEVAQKIDTAAQNGTLIGTELQIQLGLLDKQLVKYGTIDGFAADILDKQQRLNELSLIGAGISQSQAQTAVLPTLAPGFTLPNGQQLTEAQQKAIFHAAGIPGYATGGLVPGALGAPQLAIVHGGERVLTPAQQRAASGVTINQTNHFGSEAPASADLDYANRQLGWRLSRTGR